MSDVKAEIIELRIGEKIRALRQQKRLTLQNLSETTALSKPLLSQIENDQVIPPLTTLLKIAKGLGVGMHYFFEDEYNRQTYSVTKREDVRGITASPQGEKSAPHPYRYYSLSHGIRRKHMESFLIEFENRAWDDSLFFKHDGDEEFLYITEGEVDFYYHKDIVRLHQGDSIYYDSSVPHGFVAVGSDPAKAIAVIYKSRD